MLILLDHVQSMFHRGISFFATGLANNLGVQQEDGLDDATESSVESA